MNLYLVRIGTGWEFIREAKKHWFIAIDFESFNMWDLSKYKNGEDMKKAIEKTWKYSKMQVASQWSQLNRFIYEMQNGDLVISPVWDATYLVWEVWEYFYEQNPIDGCPFQYRRKVKRSESVLRKQDMSANLSFGLGSALTIYSLNKHRNEIQSLIEGKKMSPAEMPTRVRDIILANLLTLDGRQFEEFLTHLLDVIGFETETTQYVGDKAVDVIGTLYADWLANIKLKIQAKRYEKGSIWDGVVRELRGTLGNDEHGCIITTSTFTKPARDESERVGFKQITLIDGYDLASLILKHFDEIDDNYKSILGIHRKHEYNIEDQFEGSNLQEEEILGEIKSTDMVEVNFDTMICPAKEDWFHEAFLQEKARWAVRINKNRLDKIKYIAMYQVAPISAITYYGKVKKIELYEDTGKYKLYLDWDPIRIEKPIELWEDPNLSPQWSKYALLRDILKARTLKDLV